MVSFRSRNDAAYPISPDMNIGGPYTLLSQAGRQQIFGENQSGWEIFYERYPQAPGITTLSRVGFNNSWTRRWFILEPKVIGWRVQVITFS